MKLIHLIAFILVTETAISQVNALINGGEVWYEGVITLNNGEKLEGLVRYDTKKNILSYIRGDQSRSFTTRSVDRFSFFDPDIDSERMFYSINYEDEKNGAKRVYFFEVLMQLKSFAVLTKTDPIEAERTNSYYNQHDQTSVLGHELRTYSSTRLRIMQDETVYIFDEKGNIEPYLEIRYYYKNKKIQTKTKILKRKILTEYLSIYDYAVNLYAKNNKLRFDKKDDFLKIIGYYKEIASQ